jgi:hypothetical protein
VEANLAEEEIGRAKIPTTTYLALRSRTRPHRSVIVRKLLRFSGRFMGRLRRLRRGKRLVSGTFGIEIAAQIAPLC